MAFTLHKEFLSLTTINYILNDLYGKRVELVQELIKNINELKDQVITDARPAHLALSLNRYNLKVEPIASAVDTLDDAIKEIVEYKRSLEQSKK